MVSRKRGEAGNKKVRNVKSVVSDGIKFRSDLEFNCYKRLKEAGFNPEYESTKIPLFEGFRMHDSLEVWLPKYKSKRIIGFERNTSKIQGITYTPDFMFEFGDYKIIIETKGHANDAYPLRRKMFFRLLEDRAQRGEKIIFFEPHNIKQIEKTIEVIKSLENVRRYKEVGGEPE